MQARKIIDHRVTRNPSGERRREVFKFDDGSIIEKNWLINERPNIIYFIDQKGHGLALAWSCYDNGRLLDLDEIWLYKVKNCCINKRICLVLRGKNINIDDALEGMKWKDLFKNT